MTVQPFSLDAALGIPGARAVALFDGARFDAGDRSVLWSAGAPALGAEEMAAVVTLAGAAAGLVALTDPADELGDVLVTSAGAFHVLRLVGDGSPRVAYLWLRRAGANLAMARQEFKQLIEAHVRREPRSEPIPLALAVAPELPEMSLPAWPDSPDEPDSAKLEMPDAPVPSEPAAEAAADAGTDSGIEPDLEPDPAPARMVLVPDQHVPESATALLPELGPNRRPEFGPDLGPNFGPEFGAPPVPEYGPHPGSPAGGTNLGRHLGPDFSVEFDPGDENDPDGPALPRRRPNGAPNAANGSPAGNDGSGNDGSPNDGGANPGGNPQLPPLPDWLTVLGQPYQNDESVLDRILVSLRHL